MCLLLVDQVDNQFKKPADACSIWRCVLLAAGRGVSSVCVGVSSVCVCVHELRLNLLRNSCLLK